MFAFIKSLFTTVATNAPATTATTTAAEYSVMKITLYAADDRNGVSGSSVADYRHSVVVAASHYTDFDKAVSAARKSSANQPLWLATTAVVVDGVIVVAYHDGAIVAGQGYYPTR